MTFHRHYNIYNLYSNVIHCKYLEYMPKNYTVFVFSPHEWHVIQHLLSKLLHIITMTMTSIFGEHSPAYMILSEFKFIVDSFSALPPSSSSLRRYQGKCKSGGYNNILYKKCPPLCLSGLMGMVLMITSTSQQVLHLYNYCLF